MKRSIQIGLLVGLALLSMSICIAVFSACAQHGHVFGDYEVTLAADCYTTGERTRTCSVCGFTETEEIPAGHVWSEFETTVHADCDTKGERKRSCSLCGYEDIEIIQASGHQWSEFETTVPAVCEKEGKRVRTCSACGDEDIEIISAKEHQWSEFETAVPAKCEKEGKKTRTCFSCGDEDIEIIPAKEHQWSAFETTVPAKCEEAGEQTRTCSACGDVDIKEIPQNGHKWTDVAIITPATCEEDGVKSAICETCKTTSEEEVIPALGHTKASSIPLIGATCESAEKTQNKCGVCLKVYYEYPPALGHNYSEEFTVDKTPTLNEEGEQSRHCTNYKCTSRTDIQTIPRLISEAYFRINIVRGDNQILLPTTYNPMIKIVNEQGNTVASSFVFGNANKEHIFEKLLPFGTYTVSIVNQLPAGFECGEYQISEKDGIYPYDTPDKYPTITMHLYSHLGDGAMTNGDKKGTVLNDFSVTTIDGVKVTLGELLAKKKLVWLNFYYNDCSPCRNEAPEIIRVAQQFDVAVICFNNRDSVDEIRSGAKSIFKFPDSFYLVQDSGDGFGKIFGRYAYPLNVFIDSGGCVFESVTGSNYSSQFYNFVKNNLFTTPEKASNVYSELVELPVILPEKQRYL